MAASDTEWITATASILGAVGTVAAVALALWLQVWREYQTRPKLTLGIPSNQAELRIGTEDGFFGHFWLTVGNAPTARTAREVEVLLTVLTDGAGSGEAKFRDEPLRWVGQDGVRIDVPPGVQRRCVAFFAGNPEGIYDQHGLRPPLRAIEDLEWRDRYMRAVGAFPGQARVAGDIRWIEDQDEYLLQITVTAKDVPARKYEGRISVSGGPYVVKAAWIQPPAPLGQT